MSPLLEAATATSILTGVAANGMTAVLAKLGISDDDQPELLKVIREALEDTIGAYEWDGPGQDEEVSLFLKSPEVETLARDLFSLQFLSLSGNLGREVGTDKGSLERLREAFVRSLAQSLEEDYGTVKKAGRRLFNLFLTAMGSAFQAGMKGRPFGDLDRALGAYRFQRAADQLLSLEKRLSFLTSRRKRATVQEIREFELKLRSQVVIRHGTITPAHVDSTRKLPIDDIYVQPHFSLSPTAAFLHENKREFFHRRGDKSVKTHLDLLKSALRLVILGDPGGGKSTFASFLCHNLASDPDNRLVGERELTPLLVTLREYGTDRKDNNNSIASHIGEVCKSRYQLPPPKRAIEHLLLNGRLLIVLDGLDELVRTADRLEITGDIEVFCGLYPDTPVIVTSRQVGYSEAPLYERVFDSAQLAPFEPTQVEEYATKWFGSLDDLSAVDQEKVVASFMAESEVVEDIRNNPLMLSLMCTLYRGEKYIPQNRPRLYEKCAVLLFERWDKARGIGVALPFEAQVRPLMMHLAHVFFSDPRLQKGTRESRLVSIATNYLLKRRYTDRDEARAAAREFIRFCRGRAWVFTDTGTRKDGERLYQFTHRTFLEYFAAHQLVREHSTPAKLAAKLLPRIAKNESDVVAQLAFQIQNEQVEGATDDLFKRLITAAKKRKIGQWNMLEFGLRCLDFLAPHQRIVSNLVECGLERFLSELRFPPPDFIKSLCDISGDNLSASMDAIRGMVRKGLRNKDIGSKEFTRALLTLGSLQIESKDSSPWRHFCEEEFSHSRKILKQGAAADIGIASFLLWYTPVSSVTQLLVLHGSDLLLQRNFRDIKIVNSHGLDRKRGRSPAEIQELSNDLLSKSPPWFSNEAVLRSLEQNDTTPSPAMDLMLALRASLMSLSSFVDYARRLAEAETTSADRGNVKLVPSDGTLTPREISFLRRWQAGEVDVVHPATEEE